VSSLGRSIHELDSSPVVARRDRHGHAIALEIRRDGGTFSPSPVRCRICGTSLDVVDGGVRLGQHLQSSDGCREAICDWLTARRERRFSPGGTGGAE
jgi:hypothetical protein